MNDEDIQAIAAKYTKQLHSAYNLACKSGEESRYEFVATLFGLTTYSCEIDAILVTKIMKALTFIHEGQVFSLSDPDLIEHITILNLGDVISWLEWGTSIRGAWLDSYGDSNDAYPNKAALFLALKQFLLLEAQKP